MKFLVYGARGWIGGKVVQILKERGYEVIKSEVRLNNLEDVEKELDDVKPDRAMCLIGRTHGEYEGKVIPTIDYLEKPGKLKENVRDNLFSPVMLALACQKRKIHLTYMGTGCIFTYTEDCKKFTEESLPNFFGSSYSTVKGFTDQMMAKMENVLNVRIRMPISSDRSPRNFLIKMINYNRICSIPNSMTILDELLPVMCHMSLEGKTGTVNMVNPGVVEHKEILELYKKYVDQTHTYELMTYEEQMKILASERSNNELTTEKLLQYDSTVSNIRDGIEKIFKNW
jgi:3,5-epimerase/4-reductase